MLIDTVSQDLRIGLRVLVKEKAFCALVVIVLALRAEWQSKELLLPPRSTL